MTSEQPKTQHRATYARDKKKGGYLIRVAGPHASAFAGREVPVTLLNGTSQMERLESLIWSGVDTGEYGGRAGDPIALYSFKPTPKDESEAIPF